MYVDIYKLILQFFFILKTEYEFYIEDRLLTFE